MADAFGDGAPLESATPKTLLKITPIEFVSELETAIDDRGGYEDVGPPADNAYE